MKRIGKKAVIIIVSVLIAGFIGWQIYNRVFKSKKSDFQYKAMPVPVEIEEISIGDIRDTGNFSGSLESKSSIIFAPKISGRLKRLYVNIGDRVRSGRLLAMLDDEEYSQQVLQAKAELQVAEANLEEALTAADVAKREFQRVQELHKRGIASDAELDSAKGALATQEARKKVTQAQLANKDAALKASEVRLSYTRITASWDGGGYRVVGERFVDEGAMLSANTPILSVLEIDPLISVVYITDKDYFQLEKEQKAVIHTDALPGKSVGGKIVRIAPLLRETSREARVEIEFPNPEEVFKPGMFVNVEIEFAFHQGVTLVPRKALVTRVDQEGVYIADIENQQALFIPVETGIITSEKVEILKPADLSGFVVTLGQHLLAHERPIILPEEDTGEEADTLPDRRGNSGEKR